MIREKLAVWIKKVFSIKIIFGFVIILLSFSFIRNNIELSILKFQLEEMKEANYTGRALLEITPKIDGAVIENIELKGKNDTKNLNTIFGEKAYTVIVYQNGIVCNPCLEYVTSKWNNSIPEFHMDLSNEIIFISSAFDRSVLNYLENIMMENSYFIDAKEIIKKSILKNDLPVNFTLLVNKNRQIIYTSTFSSDTKENFDRFLEKANRYIRNRK